MELKNASDKAKKQLPYFLPSEIVLHNQPSDIWVSLLGLVYDLTPLIKEYEGRKEIKPLLAYAGKDISHWFNRKTKDIKYVIHPVTGLRVPYTPHGPIPHVNPQVPSPNWRPIIKPWWKDEKYIIGHLTEKARPVRFINTLVPAGHNTDIVWVAQEETVEQIAERIKPLNANVQDYTLKHDGQKIDKNKKLDENNVLDERSQFLKLGLTDDENIPAITLCFNGN